MDTLIGSSIGGYILIKLLGAGGMGSVYLAHDTAIGQQVAVKLIRTDLDGYADASTAQMTLERFKQEARAVAGLDHLHILPLYRYGEEETPQGPRSYMIMQYRPEGSLWDWLRRRADLASGQSLATQDEFPVGLPTNWPLGLEEVADYLQQAASALQYAHDRGVIHRDIKPANFLLRIDTHEKTVHLLLSDFGLAKIFTSSSATNTVLGTPTYMAPEQFEGAARPESDQYALAVMAYYLLAGRAPFEGDPMQLMRQHMMADVPSLTTFNPNIPPYINGILARALAKRPEQRYPSTLAFAEAFARVIKPMQSSQSSLALSQLTPPEPARDFTTSAYSAPTEMEYTPVPGLPGPLGLPVNNQAAPRPANPLILPGVVDPAARGGNAGMNRYNANAPAMGGYNSPAPTEYPRPTPPPAPTEYPRPISAPPAGFGGYNPAPPRSPGYPASATPLQGAGGAYNTPPNAFANSAPPASAPGYKPSNAGAPFPSAPAYQPSPSQANGQQVSRRGALGWILGTAAVVVVGGGAGAYFYIRHRLPDNALHVLKGHTGEVTSLSWLPNGTQLASGSLDQTVRLWSVPDGGSLHTLNAGANVNAVAWSPAANTLAAGTDNHSLSLWQASGSLINHLSFTGWDTRIAALAWSGDSSRLYLGIYGDGLHAIDLATYNRSGSADVGVRILSLSPSPDGHYMAVGLESGIVYLADLSDKWKDVYQFPANYGAAYSVAWSPDGSTLAVGYANNIALVYNASTRQVEKTLKHLAPVYSVAWQASASASTPILASGAGDNSVNIWNLSTEQQTIYTGHKNAVLSVSWSSTLLASASRDQTVILWQPPTA